MWPRSAELSTKVLSHWEHLYGLSQCEFLCAPENGEGKNDDDDGDGDGDEKKSLWKSLYTMNGPMKNKGR